MALVQGTNGIHIKTTATVGALGITPSNCLNILLVKKDGTGYAVYDSAIGVGNQFTSVLADNIYIFNMKEAGLNIDAYTQGIGGSVDFAKLLYYGDFTGAAGTQLSAYTAVKGTLNVSGAGTKILDGNGNLVITGGDYNTLSPAGSVPATRRVILEIASLPETGFAQMILKRKSDGGDFAVLRAKKKTANTILLSFETSSAALDFRDDMVVTYPFKLEGRYTPGFFIALIGGFAFGVADPHPEYPDIADASILTPGSETASISSFEIEAL